MPNFIEVLGNGPDDAVYAWAGNCIAEVLVTEPEDGHNADGNYFTLHIYNGHIADRTLAYVDTFFLPSELNHALATQTDCDPLALDWRPGEQSTQGLTEGQIAQGCFVVVPPREFTA